MREEMKNTDKDDYKVCFSGATISKREANKARVALLFGFIGIIVIGFAFEIQNKLAIFIISLILVCIGYFGIANRLFKKR
jgi:1,4-dihydroxy-2-naphthoate octaprenyltransferase